MNKELSFVSQHLISQIWAKIGGGGARTTFLKHPNQSPLLKIIIFIITL